MTVFKLRSETWGGHVHIDVFAGEDFAHLAKTGTLVMLPKEAVAFEANLWPFETKKERSV